MKKVEFQYFDGCPSYKQALTNLKEVLADSDLEANLELINVETPEQAEKFGFYGSPTIKVDGRDLEGRSGEFSYNCRLYDIDGELTGIPTKEYIRERLFNSNSQNNNSANSECC